MQTLKILRIKQGLTFHEPIPFVLGEPQTRMSDVPNKKEKAHARQDIGL
jgi:hypothetical protein